MTKRLSIDTEQFSSNSDSGAEDLGVLYNQVLSLDRERAESLLTELEKIPDDEVNLLLDDVIQFTSKRGKPMTRRFPEFEITVYMDDNYVTPPRPSQRNWILQRTLNEFADDLIHLDKTSKRFVIGSDRVELLVDQALSFFFT